MTPSILSKGDASALYYRVKATEGFTEAAQSLFNLVHQAQRLHPNKKRLLYLDIDGHRNAAGGFDSDMFELQKEYLLGFLMQFLTEATLPLSTGTTFRNNKPQQNEVPATFVIKDR